jgi:hypothetical protein
MRPVPGFNAIIEDVVNNTYGEKDHYRGYSPAMVMHEGQTLFVVRAANYTKCPYYAGVDAYRLTPPFESKACTTALQPMADAGQAWQPGPRHATELQHAGPRALNLSCSI